MLGDEEVLSTIRMFQQENLDVRTVTMGVNIAECATPDIGRFCERIRQKVGRTAGELVAACDAVSDRYGIPIVNKRLAVSPVGSLAGNAGPDGLLALARALDEAAAAVRVDLLGGYTALVHKGMTPAEERLIDSLPEALAKTERVCASVSLASTRAGINMDAVLRLGRIVRETALATREHDGFGAAKLCLFSNIPEDNPFMAGAYLGFGEPDGVIHVGVSGPGVVKRAVERLQERSETFDLQRLAGVIKQTAFRVSRVGELVGREVARVIGGVFGGLDLSLAPTPAVGDSVGEILRAMGIEAIGAPGCTAAVAMLNDAVKKGGLFASSSVGGLSGAFIPVAEDSALAGAAADGTLTLEKLEAMTSVCSVGLDMVCLPGDTDAETLSAIIADEMAIGVINGKTTATRLIPVPGKGAGEWVRWGGLFGASPILAVRAPGRSGAFVRHGGRIPAPVTSLRN